MKSVLLSFVFSTLISLTLHAQATLTVANGNTTNSYIPVYGYYADDYLHEQVVYPASMLTAMGGGGAETSPR